MSKKPYTSSTVPVCRIITVKAHGIICQSITGISGSGLNGYGFDDDEDNYLTF